MTKAPSDIVAPILDELRSSRSPRSKVDIYLRACREIQYQFPKEAFEYATKARATARSAGLTELEIHAQRMQGICLYADNDFEGALKSFEKTIPRYKRNKDLSGLARAYQNVGMALRGLSRNEEALRAYHESERLLHELQDDRVMAAVLTNIGSLWSVLDRPKEALAAYSEGLTIAERLDDDSWRARITGNIADIYITVGDLETAAEWSSRSLELHRHTKDMMGVGLTLSNLGRVYVRLNAPDKALAVLSEAVTVMTTLADEHARARVMVVLAGVLRLKRRHAESRMMATEALEIFEGSKDVERLIRCYIVLGECALDLGDTKAAASWFREAERRAEATDNPRVRVDIVQNLARIELAKGRWKRATALLEQAIVVAEEHEMASTSADLHTHMAEVLEGQGLLQQALDHERSAREMQHRADGELRAQHSQALQMRLDIEQAARERERLQIEQERLHFDLETKAREVNANAVLIAQKNELLTVLTQELKAAAGKATGEVKSKVMSVISRIDGHRRTGEDWRTLSEQLKEVHDDYLSTLAERFPTLTPTEIKVCSLLKLNLSSKEISEILTIGLSSVEQYRYRLRKKLGVAGSTNLATFLQQL